MQKRLEANLYHHVLRMFDGNTQHQTTQRKIFLRTRTTLDPINFDFMDSEKHTFKDN